MLNVPVGIKAEALLAAIKQVETAGGANNCPRFERAYMPKGFRVTIQGLIVVGTGGGFTTVAQQRWARWGLASAASYGPWQILYHTAADEGYPGAPWGLWAEDVSRMYVERHINRKIEHEKLATVADIADMWNSGSARDHIIPEEYIREVQKYYTLFAVRTDKA